MKFCYVDDSGTGDEPYGVMVGIIFDALRMRPTKRDWEGLLKDLSTHTGRTIHELHTRDFYPGNGPWRALSGELRTVVTDAILRWLADRIHNIVCCAVDKEKWYQEFSTDPRYSGVNTIWRFLGVHLVLAVQKHFQKSKKNKGNTVLVFDNEERERAGSPTSFLIRLAGQTPIMTARRSRTPSISLLTYPISPTQRTFP